MDVEVSTNEEDVFLKKKKRWEEELTKIEQNVEPKLDKKGNHFTRPFLL